MKAKEFIESGMLELYAAGALDEHERAEAELMIDMYPEVADELKKIRASLDSYAQLHAVAPPAWVREKVLKQIQNGSDEKIISIKRNGSKFYQYSAAASVVMLMLSSFAAFYFAGKYSSAKTELASVKTQFDTLTHNMQLVLADQSKMREEMNMINGMNTMKVKLSGTEQHPGMQVLVYYDMDSKHIMLDPGNLPVLPDSLQYQLWALAGSNVADAGVFSSFTSATQNTAPIERKILLLKSATTAEVFAITIEKFGGSPTPHTDKMVAVGKIKI